MEMNFIIYCSHEYKQYTEVYQPDIFSRFYTLFSWGSDNATIYLSLNFLNQQNILLI